MSSEGIVEDDRPSELALRKQEGTKGSARRWKLHSMHRREGGFIRRATGAGCRRDENGYQTAFPPRFCPFPLAFLSRLVLCFFLSPLIRRCISAFLFFFLFPGFLLLFVPVRRSLRLTKNWVCIFFLKTKLFEIGQLYKSILIPKYILWLQEQFRNL